MASMSLARQGYGHPAIGEGTIGPGSEYRAFLILALCQQPSLNTDAAASQSGRCAGYLADKPIAKTVGKIKTLLVERTI